MTSSFGVSLSALNVAATRMQVSANNLANRQSTGTRVNGEVVNEPYKPQRVVQTTEGGVPKANIETVTNPTQKLYMPDHPQADEQGFLEVPNVDEASELIEMKMATYDYKAALKAITIEDKMQQALLDIFS